MSENKKDTVGLESGSKDQLRPHAEQLSKFKPEWIGYSTQIQREFKADATKTLLRSQFDTAYFCNVGLRGLDI